jgi:hypothetical protein
MWAIGLVSVACSADRPGHHAGDAAPSDGMTGPPALTCIGKSGTRLRQVVRQDDDGASVVVRLVDTHFNDDCAFTAAFDGSLRCLPTAPIFRDADATFADAGIFYKSSDCTGPLVAEVHSSGTPPTYAAVNSLAAGGCTSVTHYYQLGADVTLASGALLYFKSNNHCNAEQPGAYPHRELGAELPISGFVAGTKARIESGRLDEIAFDGEDGARQCDTNDFIDGGNADTSCQPYYVDDGKIRCIPQTTFVTPVYPNASCTGSATEIADVEACYAGVQLAAQGDSCFRQKLFSLGTRLDTGGPPLYTGSVGSCTAWDSTTRQAFGLLPYAADQLAPFHRDFVRPGSRLKRGDLVTDDGLRIFRTLWKDDQLGANCTFRAGSDGKLRCMPTASIVAPDSAQLVSLYTDAVCSLPIQVGSFDASCAGSGAAPAFIDGGAHVFTVGSVHMAPLYIKGATCTADPKMHYDLGSEVLPDNFVAGTEQME